MTPHGPSPADERTYALSLPQGGEVVIHVRKDGRLRTRAHWHRLPSGEVLLRIPRRMPWEQVPTLLPQIQDALLQAHQRAAARTDQDLAQRAQRVNQRYFQGQVPWVAIRWVRNMERRLASVTLGGPTHGHIRVSHRLQGLPDWVLDYIIAHEFTHILLPKAGHSPRFWAYLRQAYPKTDLARGFLQGYFFAQHLPYEEDAL